MLGNTYHLALRPGADVVRELGGLHQFMGWDGPILTDSGGFQVFSLERLCRVTDAAVEFRSHIDGRLMTLSPERAVEIQEALGSDVAMVLDQVVALPSDLSAIKDCVSADGGVGGALPCGREACRSGAVRDRAGWAGCGPAALVCGATRGTGFPWLRRRRPECRRASGRNVCCPGRHLSGACRPTVRAT